MVEGAGADAGVRTRGAPRGAAWAAWLLAQRSAIARHLAAHLGPAAPTAAAPESEALRRFRAFAVGALRRPDAPPFPALDGLRVDPGAVHSLVGAWCRAAGTCAGSGGPEIERLLAPLAEHFTGALRSQAAARRARVPAPARRRAVTAAIDRIGDAYLAVDVDSGEIVDANPAAAALLGTARAALLGRCAGELVTPETRGAWDTHLESLTESADPRRFSCALRDGHGTPVRVEVNATRMTQRARTLALVVARTSAPAPPDRPRA